MTPLRPYQHLVVDHILENPRCAVWLSMGLGKTLATLTALDALQFTEPGPALVVAPLRVAAGVWPDEVAKWPHLRGMEVSAIVGDVKQREVALTRPANVYTINYDNLPWLVEHFGERWPFRIVIADESTRLKSFRLRQGGRRAHALGRVAHSLVDRFIQLTGTPSPNGLTDLWGQAWFLDRGERLGRTFDAFRSRWFQTVQVGADRHAIRLDPLPFAQEQIQSRLADLCLSVGARDHFDLRAPIVNTIRVGLPEKARTLYRKLEREMYLALDTGHEIEAFDAASRTMKCLQLCLAEGTQVLTDGGWKTIESIQRDDRVWDGEAWVAHGGLLPRGVRPVIECWGVRMTPEHQVLTSTGWHKAKEIVCAEQNQRLGRPNVRLPDCAAEGRIVVKRPRNVARPLYLRPRGSADRIEFDPSFARGPEVLRVPTGRDVGSSVGYTRHDEAPTLAHMGWDAAALPQSAIEGLQELWRAWHRSVRRLAEFVRSFFARYGPYLVPGRELGPHRQQRSLFTRELPVGDATATREQHPLQRGDQHAVGPDDFCASRASVRHGDRHPSCTAQTLRVHGREGVSGARTAPVFDIIATGPYNRFVVRGAEGPLLVHNCNGAIYTDETCTEFAEVHDAKLQALESIVEEAAGAPVLVAYHFRSDLARLQRAFPRGRALDKDPQTVRDWNAGKIPIMFAHPASAGHGLNLQDGGNILAVFGHWWDLEHYQQIVERIGPVRQAQSGHDRPVFIHQIVAAGTVDEVVVSRRESKRGVQDALLAAMRQKEAA